MSKNWLHPNRPNVPQPPFNLAPQQQPPQRQRSSSQGARSQPQSVPMQRQESPVPPMPGLRQATGVASGPHPNPHASTYETQPAAPAQAHTYFGPGNLRKMSPEQRAAYIRAVDARNAAQASQGVPSLASMASVALEQEASQRVAPPQPGLRPLRLSATIQPMAAATRPPSPQPSPPALDDDEAMAYLNERYPEEQAAASPQPEPPVTPPAQEDRAMAPEPPDTPSTPTPPQSPTPQATYDNTAAAADGSHRVPATRIIHLDDGAEPADAPAALLGAAAGGGDHAIVEVYSQGQVVARICLPWGRPA